MSPTIWDGGHSWGDRYLEDSEPKKYLNLSFWMCLEPLHWAVDLCSFGVSAWRTWSHCTLNMLHRACDWVLGLIFSDQNWVAWPCFPCGAAGQDCAQPGDTRGCGLQVTLCASKEWVCCSISETDNSCKVCCRDEQDRCTPYVDANDQFLFLRKGKPCTVGFCDTNVSVPSSALLGVWVLGEEDCAGEEKPKLEQGNGF